MTAIWNARLAYGGPGGGNGGGQGGGNGGGKGKKNKAPTVPDATLVFEKVTVAENAAPTGLSQDMTFEVPAG